MTVILADPDVTVHNGDVFAILPTLDPGSVDCVITSPPYWGLRDYGTGAWDGGNPDCDHILRLARRDYETIPRPKGGHAEGSQPTPIQYADVCGKCGAQRVDNQLGLEQTPDLFIARMVDVFRMVRRVLAPHGTVFLNLGDSYAASSPTGHGGWDGNNKNPDGTPRSNRQVGDKWSQTPTAVGGLKPKDLVGIPWRVALALQADGWYLRADIIWSKPNPMPESVTDRPTKAHEYVFLLARQPRYWFDAEAVREPAEYGFRALSSRKSSDLWARAMHGDPHDKRSPKAATTGGNSDDPSAGRNVRSVWEIATQPYAEAHFATFPEELVRRCLLAGCPEWVCRVCGQPRERIADVSYAPDGSGTTGFARGGFQEPDGRTTGTGFAGKPKLRKSVETLGWSDCGHGDYRPGVVLDPFLGSGTTAHVARKHGRHCVGVELSADYCQLIARRLQQLSLLA